MTGIDAMVIGISDSHLQLLCFLIVLFILNIKGQGIGPCLYIIYAKDLKPLSPGNVILKYADDTTLLVPQNSPTTLEVEFSHITGPLKNVGEFYF